MQQQLRPVPVSRKAVPLFITNLMQGMKIPLYGDGLNIRDWLHVEDHCDAIWTVLNKGKPGEVYNIGGNNEMTNRKIVETILREMGKSWDTDVQMVKDRPGHDRRYADRCDQDAPRTPIGSPNTNGIRPSNPQSSGSKITKRGGVPSRTVTISNTTKRSTPIADEKEN